MQVDNWQLWHHVDVHVIDGDKHDWQFTHCEYTGQPLPLHSALQQAKFTKAAQGWSCAKITERLLQLLHCWCVVQVLVALASKILKTVWVLVSSKLHTCVWSTLRPILRELDLV